MSRKTNIICIKTNRIIKNKKIFPATRSICWCFGSEHCHRPLRYKVALLGSTLGIPDFKNSKFQNPQQAFSKSQRNDPNRPKLMSNLTHLVNTKPDLNISKIFLNNPEQRQPRMRSEQEWNSRLSGSNTALNISLPQQCYRSIQMIIINHLNFMRANWQTNIWAFFLTLQATTC